jgi:hypothetical protein
MNKNLLYTALSAISFFFILCSISWIGYKWNLPGNGWCDLLYIIIMYGVCSISLSGVCFFIIKYFNTRKKNQCLK